MGRLLLILLIIAAVVLLWMAFKPSTWKRNQQVGAAQAPKQVKGPDDDEEFLWNIEKNRFKQRRAQEEAMREAPASGTGTPGRPPMRSRRMNPTPRMARRTPTTRPDQRKQKIV